MIQIPLSAYTNQSMQIDLDGQVSTLHVFERACIMYLDLTVGRTLLAEGMHCQPTTPVLPYPLRGFRGQFYVVDTQAGTPQTQESPAFAEWGTRFQLYWLSDDETEALHD